MPIARSSSQAASQSSAGLASRREAARASFEDILANLKQGDAVPSERELSERFGVARETVRSITQDFLVQGRIARQGRGTVVSRPKLVQPLSIRSYTEGALSHGMTPGRLLVDWRDVAADADVAPALGVSPGDAVMLLERILLADGQRIGVERTYLPMPRWAVLYDQFDPESSLYAALRAHGVRFGEARERLETVVAPDREAALMECPRTLPVLLIDRTTYDTEGDPVEVVRSYFRGDRVAFTATLRE